MWKRWGLIHAVKDETRASKGLVEKRKEGNASSLGKNKRNWGPLEAPGEVASESINVTSLNQGVVSQAHNHGIKSFCHLLYV